MYKKYDIPRRVCAMIFIEIIRAKIIAMHEWRYIMNQNLIEFRSF